MKLFVSLLVAAAAAMAQTAAADVEGKWSAPKPSVKSDGLSKPETENLKAKMQGLSELLYQAVYPLKGYDAIGTIRIESDPQNTEPLRGTVTGSVSVGLRRYRQDADGKSASREKEPSDRIEISINTVEHLVPRQPYLRDDSGPIYVEPTPIERIGSHPLYKSEASTSPVLAVIVRNESPFVPVTRMRVIQARIADARRLVADLASAGGTEQAAQTLAQTKARLAELEAEFASMTAEDRAAEALIGPSNLASGMVQPGGRGSRLVAPNPAFFSKELPKTAIHIVILYHSAPFGDRPDLEAMRRKVDLERVTKLME